MIKWLTKEYLEERYWQNGESQSEIAESLGFTQSGIGYWMKQFGIPTRRESNEIKDMVGQKCGMLTIIEFAHGGSNGAYWFCECECGKRVIKSRRQLRTNTKNGHQSTKSCGCLRGIIQRKGHGEILSMVWTNIKHGAKLRDIPFEITIEQAYGVYLDQDRKCKLSGVPIHFPLTKKEFCNRIHTASLDRIDSKMAYTVENIQWVHKVVNMMKQSFTQEQFLLFCTLIHNHQSGISNS